MSSPGHVPVRIVVFGATSAVASQAARLWVERGDHVFLVGRSQERLSALVDDLAVRSKGQTKVSHALADLDDLDGHARLFDVAGEFLGGIDAVLIAQGVLTDQALVERNPSMLEAAFRTNALSVISLAALAARRLEPQGWGCIAAIGSVAGDRGRQSNFIYGSAKAAVATFMDGLRNRLFRSGVSVVLIKPGFVDTPMTRHIHDKGALWSDARTVATGIVRAMDRKRNTAYLPWFWRPIMTVIRSIPEPLFKRLKL